MSDDRERYEFAVRIAVTVSAHLSRRNPAYICSYAYFLIRPYASQERATDTTPNDVTVLLIEFRLDSKCFSGLRYGRPARKPLIRDISGPDCGAVIEWVRKGLRFCLADQRRYPENGCPGQSQANLPFVARRRRFPPSIP